MNMFMHGFQHSISHGILHNFFGGLGCGFSPFSCGVTGLPIFNFGFMGFNSFCNMGYPNFYNNWSYPSFYAQQPLFDNPFLYNPVLKDSDSRKVDNIFEQKKESEKEKKKEEIILTDWRKSPLLSFTPVERKLTSQISGEINFGSKKVETAPVENPKKKRIRPKVKVSINSHEESKSSTAPKKGADPRFEKYLDCILEREGGYANSKYDRGGKTNFGITHSTYDAYREKKGLFKRDVRQITMEEVRDIYYNEYYLASGANKVSDPKLGLFIFDTAVNCGLGGLSTVMKLYKEKYGGEGIDAFMKARSEHYNNIVQKDKEKSEAEGKKPTQWRNLPGWQRRLRLVKEYAMENLTGLDTIA